MGWSAAESPTLQMAEAEIIGIHSNRREGSFALDDTYWRFLQMEVVLDGQQLLGEAFVEASSAYILGTNFDFPLSMS